MLQHKNKKISFSGHWFSSLVKTLHQLDKFPVVSNAVSAGGYFSQFFQDIISLQVMHHALTQLSVVVDAPQFTLRRDWKQNCHLENEADLKFRDGKRAPYSATHNISLMVKTGDDQRSNHSNRKTSKFGCLRENCFKRYKKKRKQDASACPRKGLARDE